MRGIYSASIRFQLSVQFLIIVATVALGIACSPYTLWPFFFASGAFISTCNFYCIARSASTIANKPSSSKRSLLYVVFFILRLALTGVALYVLIVQLKAPLFPLLAGLASITVGVSLWGLHSKLSAPQV